MGGGGIYLSASELLLLLRDASELLPRLRDQLLLRDASLLRKWPWKYSTFSPTFCTLPNTPFLLLRNEDPPKFVTGNLPFSPVANPPFSPTFVLRNPPAFSPKFGLANPPFSPVPNPPAFCTWANPPAFSPKFLLRNPPAFPPKFVVRRNPTVFSLLGRNRPILRCC